MFGKIINGKLIVVGQLIKTKTGWITNPTREKLLLEGYKEIEYTQQPSYDDENEKLVERYTEETTKIIVEYNIELLSKEEHNEVILTKIIEEENRITPRRQREIDLKKEGALEFAQEIENNIIELRKKFRKEEN